MYSGGFQRESQLELVPLNTTEQLLNKRVNQLLSSIKNGEIVAGVLGDSDKTVYQFLLQEKNRARIINKFFSLELFIHDFPGGWIDSMDKIESIPYKESDVFIVPIDAAVLMEATTKKEKACIGNELKVYQTTNMTKEWAKHVGAASNRKGLCIISPVKCESYFKDNVITSVTPNSDERLFHLVQDTYSEMIDFVKSQGILCKYIPIDTIGCCWITDKKWLESEEDRDHLQLHAKYSIPPSESKWSPYGPRFLMLEVLNFIAITSKNKQGVFHRLIDIAGLLPNYIGCLESIRSHCNSKKSFSRMITM